MVVASRRICAHLMEEGDLELLLPVLALHGDQGQVVREAEHLRGLPGVGGREAGPVRGHQRMAGVVESEHDVEGVNSLTVTKIHVGQLLVCPLTE